MSNRRLQGKSAIVTGAGRGIGRAIAERYAAEGAAVVLADIDGEGANAAAAAIVDAGGQGIGLPVDVSRAEQVDEMLTVCRDEYGGPDVLVNNAAIVAGAVRHTLEADEQWWDEVIAVNLKGHFLCSLAAAKSMVDAGGGTIITMSSGGATRSHRGMIAYDASKGGIEALTRALALDLAPYGIRVVGLVPGLIASTPENTPPAALAKAAETVPLGRPGNPEDLAGPAVFLASDDAAYLTGCMVTVDGGVLVQQRSPQVETFGLDRYPKVGSLK